MVALSVTKLNQWEKGFTQCEGIDYKVTFAPVTKFTNVRCLLMVATHNWPLYQMDVQYVFLHGNWVEDVYMIGPMVIVDNG